LALVLVLALYDEAGEQEQKGNGGEIGDGVDKRNVENKEEEHESKRRV
jgi:hypothetical protein